MWMRDVPPPIAHTSPCETNQVHTIQTRNCEIPPKSHRQTFFQSTKAPGPNVQNCHKSRPPSFAGKGMGFGDTRYVHRCPGYRLRLRLDQPTPVFQIPHQIPCKYLNCVPSNKVRVFLHSFHILCQNLSLRNGFKILKKKLAISLWVFFPPIQPFCLSAIKSVCSLVNNLATSFSQCLCFTTIFLKTSFWKPHALVLVFRDQSVKATRWSALTSRKGVDPRRKQNRFDYRTVYRSKVAGKI